MLACSTVPEGVRDGGVDASVDVGVDSFVRTRPPVCPAPVAVVPPACGTGGARVGLLAPDAELDASARRFDRGFVALVAAHTGVNAELTANDDDARARIERFLLEDDGFDFEAVPHREDQRHLAR